MRILEWMSEDRVDSEAAADLPVIEAIADAGHESIRILPSSSEGDPAKPIRETAGVRRLPWNPARAAWFESGEIDAICSFHRGRGIDLVWARGRGAWRAAIRAAIRLEAPLWIELGSIMEASSLPRVPRGTDLLLTVASHAEAECLKADLRDRLLRTANGDPLLVPPAISIIPGPRHTARSEAMAKIVIANPGRRPTAACLRLLETVISTVITRVQRRPPDLQGPDHQAPDQLDPDHEAHQHDPRSDLPQHRPHRPLEVFLEDPLGEHPSVQRLLRRLGVDLPGTRDRGETARRASVVRIPPLGRCRGVLGDGDALIAPQPLLRQRPAVLEAVAAGTLFASPPDPELEPWFSEGRGGVELPLRGDAARRSVGIETVLDALNDPEQRRILAGDAIHGLGALLDPRTRVAGVHSALGRVVGPHHIEFFVPTSTPTIDSPRDPAPRL